MRSTITVVRKATDKKNCNAEFFRQFPGFYKQVKLELRTKKVSESRAGYKLRSAIWRARLGQIR